MYGHTCFISVESKLTQAFFSRSVAIWKHYNIIYFVLKAVFKGSDHILI